MGLNSSGRGAMIAAAMVLGASACGADLPGGDAPASGPLSRATRARDVGVTLESIVRTDMRIATLATRPDDSALYVVIQDGWIRRLEPAAVPGLNIEFGTGGYLGPLVLDIADITLSAGEEGLGGLAFDPSGSFAYVYHSRLEDGHSVLAEYRVANDGTFEAASRRELFVIEQSSSNHNGGQLAFGPDGYLYIGVGDGSEFSDLARAASDVRSPLGKVLRIDPQPGPQLPYTIPPDNPLLPFPEADPRVWARGLRNPSSFSFDTETGDLWIADVGQAEWEEVNWAPATNGTDAGRGLHFGWSAFEGNDRYNLDVPPIDHTPPRLAYSHDEAQSCLAVQDGMVVRNSNVSALNGWYVYGDWCSGAIWAHDLIQPGAPSVLLETLPGFTQLARTADGGLYVSSHSGTTGIGVVARVTEAS